MTYYANYHVAKALTLFSTPYWEHATKRVQMKIFTSSCNLRSGSIFVSLQINIPVGMAKRKESLIQTFYKTSAAHFFDWLTFAESANQNYFRCLFFLVRKFFKGGKNADRLTQKMAFIC